MGKYIDANRLRAEIEKRIKATMGIVHIPCHRREELQGLLSFVDSLQQEQPSLPSNLDEAAEEYAYNNWEDNDYHTGASEGLPFDAIGHTEKCFKAGAEWMAGQDKETIELAEEHAYLAGAVNEREKMMKEAVCYIAQADITATGNIVIPFIRIGYTALSRYGIKVGDKVRIIIIKDD